MDLSDLDAAALDALYMRLISSGGECKVPPNTEIPLLMFDSQESEDRFLELIAQDPPPAARPDASRYHFVAGQWVQTEG